jgi:nitrogen fixation-related uncharacterized protein
MMKSVLLAVGLSLLVTAVGVACIWELTRWNLSALKNVEPLSWDAVSLVWAYAFGFTAVVVLVLIAVAVLLWLAEVGRSATTPSSAAPPPS